MKKIKERGQKKMKKRNEKGNNRVTVTNNILGVEIKKE